MGGAASRRHPSSSGVLTAWIEAANPLQYYLLAPKDLRYCDTGTWRPIARHNGTCSVGFVDGHAKTLPITVIIGPVYGDAACIWDTL